MYARDFAKNEVALARYLRGVGFKSFATYPEASPGANSTAGVQPGK